MEGPRTLAPPERRTAEVGSCEPVGPYRLIGVRDAGGPPGPRPGQFYMLAATRGWGAGASERPYLPRALSFARARPDLGGGAQLEFLLEDVGPGTRRLCELRAGDRLELLGPLGAGFSAPAPGTRPVLCGGGIGVAPLLCWLDELGSATTLLGFRSGAHAQAAALFGGAAQVATDDGAAGRRALVTDLLEAELARDGRATVYACGPEPMLAAVRSIASAAGVPCQLALEAGMACGYGACFGCVVPTIDGYRRVCVDGPVFDASVLA